MIPNHVLILGAPNTGKLRTCQIISSQNLEFDSVDAKSHSGLIFKTDISTKYYSLKLNILVDEYPQRRRDLSNSQGEEEMRIEELKLWLKEFMSDEFLELREAIEGLIFCFNIEKDSSGYIQECLDIFLDIRKKLNEERDDNFFSVIVGDSSNRQINEEIEDLVIPFGFEYVNLFEKGVDEFGDKIGQERLNEIIKTHEWSQMDLKQDTDLSAYKEKKHNDMNDMKKRLLDEHEGKDETENIQIDLNDILAKVQHAKQNIHDMDDNQKEAYANKVIKNIIDYI